MILRTLGFILGAVRLTYIEHAWRRCGRSTWRCTRCMWAAAAGWASPGRHPRAGCSWGALCCSWLEPWSTRRCYAAVGFVCFYPAHLAIFHDRVHDMLVPYQLLLHSTRLHILGSALILCKNIWGKHRARARRLMTTARQPRRTMRKIWISPRLSRPQRAGTGRRGPPWGTTSRSCGRTTACMCRARPRGPSACGALRVKKYGTARRCPQRG